jgi:DNA-binding response OmpR family regulator
MESLAPAVRGWVTCEGCGHMWPLGAEFSSGEIAPRDKDERESRARVLVAQDDHEATAVAAAIRSLGVDVDVAADGVLALEAFRLRPYDLVLIDAFTPHMNGVEAIAAMRAHDASSQPRVPILICTSSVDEPMHQQWLQAGADLVLHKDLGLDQIRTQVAAHLTHTAGRGRSSRHER